MIWECITPLKTVTVPHPVFMTAILQTSSRGLSRVCLGGTYPSKHLDEYFERMHDNAVRMFKEIGIEKWCSDVIRIFMKMESSMLYDTGFRLQGEAPHLLMKAIHGFDQREMLIRFCPYWFRGRCGI